MTSDTIIKSHKVQIYPNQKMRNVLDSLIDYNRFCYNKGLELWNDMYDESCIMNDKSLRPTESKVRDSLVYDKTDWQYRYSARVLQQAIHRLGIAWSNFFNPRMKNTYRPKFHSKRKPKQSFTSDRITISDEDDGYYLRLDKPRATTTSYDLIKMAEPLRFTGDIKMVTITKHHNKYFACIVVKVPKHKSINHQNSSTGVDMNIKHIDWSEGTINTLTTKMIMLQKRIVKYNQILANKRNVNPTHFRSKNYIKTQLKLNRDYEKIYNLQEDLIQKTTHDLVVNYGLIGIEDLNVNAMKMSKHLAKNIQRGLFGRFRETLSYKSKWNNISLVLVDRFYPSTQICSSCGYCKTKDDYGGKQTLFGDSIHHEHQKYYCYNCGAILDRDENAVNNIKNYAIKQQRAGLQPS